MSSHGIRVRQALNNKDVKGRLSVLLVVGRESPGPLADASKMNSILEKDKYHFAPAPDKKELLTTLYFARLGTKLQGTNLLDEKLGVVRLIEQFIERRLVIGRGSEVVQVGQTSQRSLRGGKGRVRPTRVGESGPERRQAGSCRENVGEERPMSELSGGITTGPPLMITLYSALVTLAFWVLAISFCIFWVCQFVQLMLLSDADFPGRYDRYIWIAAFFLFFLLVPFAFYGWKFAYKAMLAAKTGAKEPPAVPYGQKEPWTPPSGTLVRFRHVIAARLASRLPVRERRQEANAFRKTC